MKFSGDIRQRADSGSCWCTGQSQCPAGRNWSGGESYCSSGLKCCLGSGESAPGGANPTPPPTTGSSGATTKTTCDNGVPVNGTACNTGTPSKYYVCVNPNGSSTGNMWSARDCPAGQTCQGNSCGSTPAPTKSAAQCTYWCGATSTTPGFCGDEGVNAGKTCNEQIRDMGGKPCYETGTCDTCKAGDPKRCTGRYYQNCVNGYWMTDENDPCGVVPTHTPTPAPTVAPTAIATPIPTSTPTAFPTANPSPSSGTQCRDDLSDSYCQGSKQIGAACSIGSNTPGSCQHNGSGRWNGTAWLYGCACKVTVYGQTGKDIGASCNPGLAGDCLPGLTCRYVNDSQYSGQYKCAKPVAAATPSPLPTASPRPSPTASPTPSATPPIGGLDSSCNTRSALNICSLDGRYVLDCQTVTAGSDIGRWNSVSNCSYGCTDNARTGASCNPRPASTTLSTPATSATPAPICLTSEYRCSGNTLLRCNSARTGWTTVQECSAYGCNTDASPDKCNACPPGNSICINSGKQLQVCPPDGSSWRVQNCSSDQCVEYGDHDFCSSTTPPPTALPTPTTITDTSGCDIYHDLNTCSSDRRYVVTCTRASGGSSTGSWITVETCASDTCTDPDGKTGPAADCQRQTPTARITAPPPTTRVVTASPTAAPTATPTPAPDLVFSFVSRITSFFRNLFSPAAPPAPTIIESSDCDINHDFITCSAGGDVIICEPIAPGSIRYSWNIFERCFAGCTDPDGKAGGEGSCK